MRISRSLIAVLLILFAAQAPVAGAPIDRHALVHRHDPDFTRVDPHAPLMIGNGELGFTADITGLQTFPEQYSPLAPLLTMAQWAWHSFPNPNDYTEADGFTNIAIPGRGDVPYAWMKSWSDAKARPAFTWLRENPHRFSLGRIALALTGADGKPAAFTALSETRQHLNLWTGALLSSFTFEGEPVTVETRMDPDHDRVLVAVTSPLVASGRDGVDVRYPGVSAKINPDPEDWTHPENHKTTVREQAAGHMLLERQIDDTHYWSGIDAPGARISAGAPHEFRVRAKSGNRLIVMVAFDRERPTETAADYDAAVTRRRRSLARLLVDRRRHRFHRQHGPARGELERRVVLSQYLEAINGAGDLRRRRKASSPTAGTANSTSRCTPCTRRTSRNGAGRRSWSAASAGISAISTRRRGSGPQPRRRRVVAENGRAGRAQQPEHDQSLHHVAAAAPDLHGRARLPRAPDARDARALWRARRRDRAPPRDLAALGRQEEALRPRPADHSGAGDLRSPDDDRPDLRGRVFPLGSADGAALAHAPGPRARCRLGPRDPQARALAQAGRPLLAGRLSARFWRVAASPACKGHAIEAECLNRDHPSFLLALGLIASDRISVKAMRRTMRATEANWDLRQTWGWDFPVLAMTAARLGEPENAVDWLFADEPNNHWGASGMTPRSHLDVPGPGSATPPAMRADAETYFPSNGSLLLAVGMMAAGWDGSKGEAPGFPKAGWNVKVEGITPVP